MPIYTPGKLTLRKDYIPLDASYSSVSLLLHGDGPDGSTVIIDNSPTPKQATIVSGAQIRTAQSKFGGSSIYPAGFGSAVQFPAGTAFQYGTGDFTIEAWVYILSFIPSGSVIFSQSVSGTNYFVFGVGASGSIIFTGTASGGGTSILGPSNISLNTWAHIAACRESGIVRVFVNGISGTPTSNSTNFSDTTRLPTVGNYSHAFATVYTEGYIDELRITKGIARYQSTFTPPTAPFPDRTDG
tara:strand:- start:899 stop:1624 length:726 start_codon:yes stop_codon:yes gene_type:complete